MRKDVVSHFFALLCVQVRKLLSIFALYFLHHIPLSEQSPQICTETMQMHEKLVCSLFELKRKSGSDWFSTER